MNSIPKISTGFNLSNNNYNKTLFSIITLTFNIFTIHPALAAADIFADIPLHLQSKATTISAYSVKPNITLYIDDSGSMSMNIVPMSYKCRISHWIPNPSGNGGKWEPYGSYQYGFDTIPKNTKEIRYSCNTYRRIDSVKEVLTDIITNYHNDMYFAFRPMCGTGDQKKYNQFYDTSDPDNYSNMLNSIKNLETPCDTPTTRQFPVIARNLVINKLKYRCQKSYIIILSDGEADNTYAISDKSFKGKDSRYDGYFDRDYTNENDRLAFFSKNHNTNKPLRLKYYTDRLSNYNFGNYIYQQDYYSSNGKSINVSPTRRTVDDAGQPWNEVDPQTKKRFRQTAQTFTIGVGLGQRDTNDAKIAIPYLENAATPSGEYNPKTNPLGRFFNANSRSEIIAAFDQIFKTIKSETSSSTIQTTTVAPTVAISNTATNDISITAKVESGSWSSQICINELNTKSNQSNTCNKQPYYKNRKLLLNDGTNTYLYNSSLNALNNNTFKIPNNGKNQMEWRDGLLAWFGRTKSDSTIKQPEFSLDYRQRNSLSNYGATNNIGDIIDNPIVTIGKSVFNRQQYMLTTANDGMVYVFASSSDPNYPYDLKFNFVPMAIERQSNDGSDLLVHYMKDLTQKNYGQNEHNPHRFLLNGGMVVQQTDSSNNKPQQIFMVSTLGQAGRGAFAINIGGHDVITGKPIAAENMNSANWYKDVFLFQTPTGNANQFGYTIGTPAIARVRVNTKPEASAVSITDHIRQAAFISNGYNYSPSLAQDLVAKQSPESALFIYDILGIDVGTETNTKTGMQKGELIAKIVAPNGNGGLSSPTVIDIDGDGVADIIYAGDYSGNLYRFDLRSPNPKDWKAYRIFAANAPITAAPAVYLLKQKSVPSSDNKTNRDNLTAIVTFGTGSDIYQSDLNNKDQQTVYGIYDDLNAETVQQITPDQLLQQQFSSGKNYRLLSNYTLKPAIHKGWYFKLQNDNGERIVSKPVLLSYAGALLSRQYSVTKEDQLSDPCKPTQVSQYNSISTGKIQYNIKNGGALTQNDPYFIFDESAPIGSSTFTNGPFSFTIAGNQTNDIGGSLTQKPLGYKISEDQNCIRANIVAATTDGSTLGLKYPRCPIRFHSLSWREIKMIYYH